MNKPLRGCFVLDLTRVLAGPYCTMLLGDLGARVVKVEIPELGDDSRGFGPFKNEESGYFMSVNRNKESMTINLKSTKGKLLLKKLVERADILVENYRPGTLEKLGLSYSELKEINPNLVYTSVSGFGHTGPYKNKPAYDIIVQAMGGLMSITGHPEGEPIKAGASIGDITAGLFAAIGTLGAIYHVKQGGEGQHVDISMLDSQVAILENAISRYTISKEVPKPIGNRHPSISPFCSLKGSDGYVIVAVGSNNLWVKFCNCIEANELIEDKRFFDNQNRTENWIELEDILNTIFSKKTQAEWIKLLEKEGIPCSPIHTINQVMDDPQVNYRNMIIEMDHQYAGKFKVAGNPIKYSNTPCDLIEIYPPMLGEHTGKIMNELGFSDDEINLYIRENAI